MSQAGIVDIVSNNPNIPTTFDTDTGSAVPIANVLEISGLTVANGTYATPLHTTGSGNTVTINAQVGAAITGAPADKNDAGIVSFDDTAFGVDANGFVTLLASGNGIMENTGDDAIAVLPDAMGNFNWIGVTVANATHAKPVFFKDSTTANAIDLDVQVAADITGAPADTNDAGLASFNDTQFVVTSNGYVSMVGGTDLPAIQTNTTDDAVVVGPDASGNIDVLGRSGSKTSGSLNTVTVKSPPYADQGVGTVTLNSGSFVTGAVTITLPASAGLADGDLVEIVATNGVVTVQLVGTQVGHLGADSTTAAGTFTGSATGDVLCLRYQASTDDWWATSAIGVWTLA